jgi:hypothetical protein
MNNVVNKKRPVKFPTRKIHSMVATVLPKGSDFHVHVSDSKIGKMKIVRVVTPAWKRLRPSDRIGRVLEAADTELSAAERKNILRFSVLTPDEYKEVVSSE